MYSPELFPGLRFVPKDIDSRLPSTKALVFQEGNVVICGAKKREELLQTWIALKQILRPFKDENVGIQNKCIYTNIDFERLFAGQMRQKETTAPVMIFYCVVAIAWVWVASKISVEWSKTLQFEKRRLNEARLLVETMCSSVRGASLAMEFAKCEEAHITLMDERMVWMRTFEKTIRNVTFQLIEHATKMTISSLSQLLIIALGLAVLGTGCKMLTSYLDSDHEINVLSPIAQARLHSFIDMGNSGGVHTNKLKNS